MSDAEIKEYQQLLARIGKRDQEGFIVIASAEHVQDNVTELRGVVFSNNVPKIQIIKTLNPSSTELYEFLVDDGITNYDEF